MSNIAWFFLGMFGNVFAFIFALLSGSEALKYWFFGFLTDIVLVLLIFGIASASM